jgi:hypothetical protein
VSTFEIQVYKSGVWNIDSYFDDREIAMSEAERLNESGRHAGVRILQEDYDEASNRSKCRVVYSRTKHSNARQERRGQGKRASMNREGASTREGNTRPSRRRPSPKNSSTSLYIGFVVALMVLIAGAAAMIGLQEIAKYL